MVLTLAFAPVALFSAVPMTLGFEIEDPLADGAMTLGFKVEGPSLMVQRPWDLRLCSRSIVYGPFSLQPFLPVLWCRPASPSLKPNACHSQSGSSWLTNRPTHVFKLMGEYRLQSCPPQSKQPLLCVKHCDYCPLILLSVYLLPFFPAKIPQSQGPSYIVRKYVKQWPNYIV